MGISNFPFPSFTLLLTSDRVVIPGRSYVFRLAPLVVSHPYVLQDSACMSMADDILDDDLAEEIYHLANLELENDSTMDIAFRHEEFAYDITDMMSISTNDTRSVETTITGSSRQAREKVGVGIKLSLPFLKARRTARFQLKSIFKRLSQLKLK